MKESKSIIINSDNFNAKEDGRLTSSNTFVAINENAGAILNAITSLEIEISNLTSELSNPNLKESAKIRIKLQIEKLHAQIREQRKKVYQLKPDW